jgi:hypothetical protein
MSGTLERLSQLSVPDDNTGSKCPRGHAVVLRVPELALGDGVTAIREIVGIHAKFGFVEATADAGIDRRKRRRERVLRLWRYRSPE